MIATSSTTSASSNSVASSSCYAAVCETTSSQDALKLSLVAHAEPLKGCLDHVNHGAALQLAGHAPKQFERPPQLAGRPQERLSVAGALGRVSHALEPAGQPLHA